MLVIQRKRKKKNHNEAIKINKKGIIENDEIANSYNNFGELSESIVDQMKYFRETIRIIIKCINEKVNISSPHDFNFREVSESKEKKML